MPIIDINHQERELLIKVSVPKGFEEFTSSGTSRFMNFAKNGVQYVGKYQAPKHKEVRYVEEVRIYSLNLYRKEDVNNLAAAVLPVVAVAYSKQKLIDFYNENLEILAPNEANFSEESKLAEYLPVATNQGEFLPLKEDMTQLNFVPIRSEWGPDLVIENLLISKRHIIDLR